MDDRESDYFLERLKLYLEMNKHISTLSVATLVLLLVLDQRIEQDLGLLGLALLFSGGPLLVSLGKYLQKHKLASGQHCCSRPPR